MTSTSTETLQLLLFTVSGNYYAIDIQNLKDVNKEVRITEVPGSPSEVSGIVNIRGELITVCELPPYLSGSERFTNATVIRLKNSPDMEAFRANTIIDIVEAKSSQLEPAAMRDDIPEFISHIFVHGSISVMIIDTTKYKKT